MTLPNTHISRLCMTRGCPNPTVGRRDHCLIHEPEPYASSHRRGLPPNWDRLRAAALKRDGFRCRYCNAPATQVDHHIPRADGGKDDMGNLRSTCDHCHQIKTREEAQRAWIRSRPIDR